MTSTADGWPLLRNGRTAAGEEPCHCGVWSLDARNNARTRTGTPTCVKSTGRGTACLTPAARVIDGATYCAAHEPPCFTLEEKPWTARSLPSTTTAELSRSGSSMRRTTCGNSGTSRR